MASSAASSSNITGAAMAASDNGNDSKDPSNPVTWFSPKKPKTSGDAWCDAQNQACYENLVEILEQCGQNPEDVSILRSKAKELAKARQERTQRNSAVGSQFSSFGTISQLDENIVSQWVVAHSDLSVDDLKLVKKYDSSGVHHLYSHATQLSLSLKLPQALKQVEIFQRWSTVRATQVGDKLKTFKADGKLAATGALDFAGTIVRMTWSDEGVLTAMTHVASNAAAVLPAGSHVTKEYDFKNFWCECDATIKLGCFPGLKLLMFFPTAAASFGYPLGHNQKKDVAKLTESVEPIVTKFNQEMQALVASQAGAAKATTEQIAAAFKEVASEKRSAQAAGARAKALDSIRKTTTKRKLKV